MNHIGVACNEPTNRKIIKFIHNATTNTKYNEI